MARPQMQMLVTRFERLSRRIGLAGHMSGHRAEKAIGEGRVRVDGKVATANFKIFSEAMVTVDGVFVPPPEPRPTLWALFKPRKVHCDPVEKEGVETLRSMMRRWTEKEVGVLGNAASLGRREESVEDRHFVVVCGLPAHADGLVLLTNDGLFAEELTRPTSRIHTIYDVKIEGDPPIDLLHQWRKGARIEGINYGKVFCSLMKRIGATSRLRIRYVETPDRPLDMLLERGKMRAHRVRRYAFGPYVVTQLPLDRCVKVAVHENLRWFCPQADMRQALVPAGGAIISEDGRLRKAALERSVVPFGADPPPQVELTHQGRRSMKRFF